MPTAERGVGPALTQHRDEQIGNSHWITFGWS